MQLALFLKAMSLFVLLLCLATLSRAQGFCQRGQPDLLDTGGQCLRSGDYDVANCCYVCPVQSSTALLLYCESLYDIGYAACGQAGALAARQAACAAKGGDITSGAFTCQCNAGTNLSQINYTATTVAPTNEGGVPTVPLLMFFSVFMLYTTTH